MKEMKIGDFELWGLIDKSGTYLTFSHNTLLVFNTKKEAEGYIAHNEYLREIYKPIELVIQERRR